MKPVSKGQIELDRRLYQQQLAEIAAAATPGVQVAWTQGEPEQLAKIAVQYAEALLDQAYEAAARKYPEAEPATSSAGREEPEPRAQ